MKNNNKEVFIIVGGLLIICVFIGVIAFNYLPNNERSASYYIKPDEKINAKLDKVYFENGMLTIETTNAMEYCAKTTKSIPSKDSICWKKINSNITKTDVYMVKKYYIWIKDYEGNISDAISINS